MNSDESNELKSVMERLGFMLHIDETLFQKLTQVFIKKSFKQGEIIIKKDDLCDSIYFVSKGIAQTLIEDINDSLKESNKLHEGEFFGEVALLTGGVRTAWVGAANDVDVFVIKKEDLESTLMKIPEISNIILEKAKNRMFTF